MEESNVSIKKGTQIFQGKPFAYILNSKHRFTRCDHCFKSGKLSKCSGCECVSYCDRTCQKESWSIHKAECANLKRVSPKIVPDMARLIARIIVKLNNGGGEELGYYSKTKYRKFKDLMSHYTDIKKDLRRMEHIMSLSRVLFDFLGDTLIPNSAEIIGIYGRICINSFDIVDIDTNSIGVGIYLGPSIIDHSCKPNAVAIFEGTTIAIRMLIDMPYLDWSQIRISYIDILKSTKDRQTELQKTYYFLCNCEKCKNPEITEKAAACPNKTCTFPCVSYSDLCQKCGTNFPEDFQDTFDQVSEFTAQHVEKMETIAYLDISKMCLAKQEGVLHSLNILRVRTLHSAFDSAVSLERWEEADIYAKELLPGLKLYIGELHPLIGILYLMIGKIRLHLQKLEKAREALSKALKILEVTHGEKSTLVREKLRPCLLEAAYSSE